MSQNILHYERILSRAHANYLGQINVELAKSSNRTNDSIAWLTCIGTMLIPMHVITGK
jgi:magnesium transporter